MKYIKNLERNQYWNQNKFGYSDELSSAGVFDSHDEINILRDANINGMVNELSISPEDILTETESSPFKKVPIKDVMESIDTSKSYENNPISEVFNKLIDNHYYPTEEFDNLREIGNPINYNEKFDVNMKIHGEKDLYVKMSIYRKESGHYELTTYANYDLPNKSKNNEKKRKLRM